MTNLTAKELGTAVAPRQGRLVQAIYELCKYIAARVGTGPPEPEDVVQAAFTKFAALKAPEKVVNPRAFLYRTALNIVIDANRRAQRHHASLIQGVAPDLEEATDDLEPERVLLGKEALLLLRQAVLTLPPRDRSFLLAHRLEGLSYAEIARRANMAPSTVREIVEKSFAVCAKIMREAD